MKVTVYVELEPGHERRGFAGSIRQKAYELPMCPGPGWWLDLEEDQWLVHSAGVGIEPDGCWCSFRVRDMGPFTADNGWL